MISSSKKVLTFSHLFHLPLILSINHLLGQSFSCPCILNKLGKASTASEPHCRCLGMLPKNVPKHRYCLGFFLSPNWICYHSACEGLKQLGEYFQGVLTTVCSPDILKIYQCTSLSVLPAAAAAGGRWELKVLIHRRNIYIKMSYYSSLRGIISVILV